MRGVCGGCAGVCGGLLGDLENENTDFLSKSERKIFFRPVGVKKNFLSSSWSEEKFSFVLLE